MFFYTHLILLILKNKENDHAPCENLKTWIHFSNKLPHLINLGKKVWKFSFIFGFISKPVLKSDFLRPCVTCFKSKSLRFVYIWIFLHSHRIFLLSKFRSYRIFLDCNEFWIWRERWRNNYRLLLYVYLAWNGLWLNGWDCPKKVCANYILE